MILTNKRLLFRPLDLTKWGEQDFDINIQFIEEDNIKPIIGGLLLPGGVRFFAKGREFQVFKMRSIPQKDGKFKDGFIMVLKQSIKERRQKLLECSDKDELNNVVLKALGNIIHVDGIPFLSGKESLLKLHPNKLIVTDINEKNSYKIRIENISDVKVRTEVEISEQERNVLARAIAGGILFGEMGAIVGGISGVPKKQIKTLHNFLIIDYVSKGGNQKSLMFLYKSGPKQVLERFADAVIKEVRKHKPQDSEVEL